MRFLLTIGSLLVIVVLIGHNLLDPYDRHSLVVGSITLGLTLFSLTLAIVLRASCDLAFMATAGVVLLFSMVWWESAPSKSQLAWRAEPTIVALQDFYEKHQLYPDSLDRIDRSPPSTRYGAYRYETMDSGRSFKLQIGDYGLDQFTGWYTSDYEGWKWDS